MAHNNERVALTPEALLAGCARLHAEGAGRFALEIHRAANIATLRAAAVAGDTGAAAILAAVDDFVERCGKTLCLHCPRPLAGRPAAVILVHAMRADAREALAFGVCRGCAGGRTDRAMAVLAMQTMRQIFPDLHEIVAAPAGCA